ncbi:hypothetical protein MATL_G00062860 [Megalops atlanticus]|uniref:Uncharacterized protein n=1 Tax=Megalops atlanticus TaxID=7932 RepID=A0A9D3QBS2_MEGAT|nr:hypothetical protein MATL_G00062860 [Megalops atlanticus]
MREAPGLRAGTSSRAGEKPDLIPAVQLQPIFKATVNDILDSVEETLSEYQEKIQRIEAENENLRRSLQGREDENGGAKKDVAGRVNAPLSPETENCAVLKQPSSELKALQTTVTQSNKERDFKENRRFRKKKSHHSAAIAEREAEHVAPTAGTIAGSCNEKAFDDPASTSALEYVNHDLDVEQDCAIDLSTTQASPSLAIKKIKMVNEELDYADPEHYVNVQSPHSPELDSRDSDCGTLKQILPEGAT